MSHDLKISANAKKFDIRGGSKLEIFDEDGSRIYEGEFKSFTSNFLKLLYGSMVGAGTAKAKDLSNTDVEMNDFPTSLMNLSGGATLKKFGVVVGTNDTAVLVSDYNISVPSGLTLAATSVGASSVGADSVSVEISRQISNTTGSTISLKEAGLICGSEDETDANVLIARDLLDITLENGKKSVWRYIIDFNFANDIGGFVKTFVDKMFSGIFEKITDNANWALRDQIGCVVFDEKIWVMGGGSQSNRYNDVWYSSDGITWTKVTTSSPIWGARVGFGCVVFDGKIWVMGGNTGNSLLHDVWYSSNGKDWIQTTASAGWSARYEFGCVVFDGKIWVMGGNNSSGQKNDVWYSSDGITWTKVTTSSPIWGARTQFGCVVFDGKIWVIGGFDNSWSPFSDVWYSSNGKDWMLATASASFGDQFGCGIVSNATQMFLIKNGMWYSSDGITWIKASLSALRHSVYIRVTMKNKQIYAFPGRLSGDYYHDVWSSKNFICDLRPGSSDTSFSATSTALGSLIADGSGSGELIYGTMPDPETTEPSTSGNKTTFSLAREFTNSSGADITIKEVGLFCDGDLAARLILADPITIPNAGSEIITIDFETEV